MTSFNTPSSPSSPAPLAPLAPLVPLVPPQLEPIRLVMVPLCCFYCGNQEDVQEWRICNLFGIFHCDTHAVAAERDCKSFMRNESIVRYLDARDHPVLAPFLLELGSKIPVLRSSGTVETDWFFPACDDLPHIRKSKTTCEWGFNLTNGIADKFVPLCDFRDPRVAQHVPTDVIHMLETVIDTLNAGVYV
jgi:hypothetical protein